MNYLYTCVTCRTWARNNFRATLKHFISLWVKLWSPVKLEEWDRNSRHLMESADIECPHQNMVLACLYIIIQVDFVGGGCWCFFNRGCLCCLDMGDLALGLLLYKIGVVTQCALFAVFQRSSCWMTTASTPTWATVTCLCQVWMTLRSSAVWWSPWPSWASHLRTSQVSQVASLPVLVKLGEKRIWIWIYTLRRQLQMHGAS